MDANDATVPLSAQQVPQGPTRAIRRDLPLTNTIRRAFTAGTRDSTGRPGRNYWQLWMDYTIAARLEPATSMLSGRETIKLHNASDSALSSIMMRFDQNIFRGDVPRGASIPAENHEGFVITRLAVNGITIDVGASPPARAAYGSASASGPFVAGLHSTSARIGLSSPIAARSTATIEVEWHFKLAGGNGSGHRMTYRWGDTLYQVAQWYPRVAMYPFVQLPLDAATHPQVVAWLARVRARPSLERSEGVRPD